VDGAGRRWEHRYDADGALVARIAPTGEVARYVYDEAGRVTAVTDRTAGTRRFDYDAAGRLVAATDANGATTRYAYNERDLLTEIADPLGGVTAPTTRLAASSARPIRSAASQLWSTTRPGGSSSMSMDRGARGAGPTMHRVVCARSAPPGASRS
jgi:YD repeat-containing protein